MKRHAAAVSPLRPLLLPAVLLPLLLAGCSGGSGGPTDPDVSAAEAAVVESMSFELVSSAREDAGLDPLAPDPTLDRVARRHSEAMRDQGFFAHVDPAGTGVGDRLRAAGVSFRRVGENLAMVEKTSDPAGFAHRRLLANPPHRANILGEHFTHLGVGVARDGDTWWITQVYVRR